MHYIHAFVRIPYTSVVHCITRRCGLVYVCLCGSNDHNQLVVCCSDIYINTYYNTQSSAVSINVWIVISDDSSLFRSADLFIRLAVFLTLLSNHLHAIHFNGATTSSFILCKCTENVQHSFSYKYLYQFISLDSRIHCIDRVLISNIASFIYRYTILRLIAVITKWRQKYRPLLTSCIL